CSLPAQRGTRAPARSASRIPDRRSDHGAVAVAPHAGLRRRVHLALAAAGRVTTLAKLLARRIALTGPISVAEFMAEALGHPIHGYYQRRDPFGSAGDFITAPEVSQMFGEMIGLWFVEVWQAMGSPSSCQLVVLGRGRGTLMADALRAARIRPAFGQAARLHLVETSPHLRERQS